MRHIFPPNKLASGYICLQCRHRGFAIARNARISPPVCTSFRRYASSGGNENSITERIRRKIWKSEPPGQKDPYDPNEVDALRAHEASRAEEEKVDRDEPTKLISQAGQYVEATTLDGLERIGGPTGWWEEAWDKVNKFDGWDFSTTLTVCIIADAECSVSWRLRGWNLKKILRLRFTVLWLKSIP